MSDYLDPNNEELLKDFFMEAETQVDTLEQNILTLENDPANHEAIDEIFRAAHTLKGASATVQMNELTTFTHLCEDVLDDIRSGKISAGEDVVDALLSAIDVIKSMLAARSSGGIYEEDISALSATLRSFLSGGKGQAPPSPPPAAAAVKPPAPAPAAKVPPPPPKSGLSEYDLLELLEAIGKDQKLVFLEVSFNQDNPMNTVGGIQVFAALKSLGNILMTNPDFDSLYEDVYYPVVKYFLGTAASREEITKALELPDTVTGFEFSILEEPADAPSPAPAAKPSAPSPAPAPAAKPQAPSPAPANPPAPSEGPSPETPPAKAPPHKDSGDDEKAGDGKKNLSGSILRVDAIKIDNLLNLVSETVITKAAFNQISALFGDLMMDFQTHASQQKDRINSLLALVSERSGASLEGGLREKIQREISLINGELGSQLDGFYSRLKNTIVRFRSTSQSLSRTTGELQEGVMQIRMVPISQIFSRFPRLVRDISKGLNKKIVLQIEGEETELDKSVIDDLLDPLIHCVRNSADHGIESPEERLEKNKPAEGTILLKASNEGNMIIIDIIDDGAGIDVEAVREKAIDRGVIHPSKKLSDLEAFNLIFEPGFSTAKVITNISGRGVGLDVVKKQIEKLNGSVTVWSEMGQGTRFTIKLPLTLAIIQGLLVRVGQEIYAIPITSVMDSHRIKNEDIKKIDNYEVFNVRDEAVSLLRLSRLFKIPSDPSRDYHYVVLVGTEDKKMGLMVDALIGEEDVVMKPLKDKYTNSPGIAGATILGDGTVSLIMDISQLLELGFREEMAERRRLVASIL
ncbi:MAG: chemotaxis protein CheA [Spirochaetales bacterium]|jgi:two-component system chemotaxis sensor kinase CheA|nr:chemotaxis protein CheA [Spirochaetales bacterium]